MDNALGWLLLIGWILAFGIVGVLAAMLYVPSRFSLRSLIIAVTVFAFMLGMASALYRLRQ
jgi:hypothetical protein